MKRTLIISIIAALLFVSCTSDPAVNAAFRKYSSKEGVVSLTVPGFVVRTAAMFAELEPCEEELLSNVSLVKVLAIENPSINNKAHFYTEFSKYLSEDYTPLMSVKDGKDNVQVLAKMKTEEDISDLLVMVSGDDNALIYIRGNFNLSKLAESTDLLKGKGLRGMISMK